MIQKIKIKALSVNQAFQGRRFRSPKYNNYEIELISKLKMYELPKPPYKLLIEFGHSSSLFDIDNGLKPFIDVLQKKYNFNDRYIYHLTVVKKIVPKKEEYIKFQIKHYEKAEPPNPQRLLLH